MSQRVVSLVLQWSRFYLFFFVFFPSVVLCRCSPCNSVVRSDVLGRPIGRSSVEQERERGVQGGSGRVGRRKRSHHSVTQIIIHPCTCTHTQTKSSQ